MPVTLADCSIVVDTAPQRDVWCAYEHHAALEPGAPPVAIFVGACRLIDVYRLIDGRVNSDWQGLFAQGGHVLVRIIATGDRNDIIRHTQAHIRSLPAMPRCNARGFNVKGSARAVTCNETGRTYPSQREAALGMGVSQSAISQQLSGRLKHVQGYTFRFSAPPPHKRADAPQTAPEPLAGPSHSAPPAPVAGSAA